MRWNNALYSHGNIRRRTAFLWLPKRIGAVTRWLERATWEERFVSLDEPSGIPLRVLYPRWGYPYFVAVRWISNYVHREN